MNIFIFLGICVLAALVPASAVGGIYWAAVRDARRQEDALARWLAARISTPTAPAPRARRAAEFLRERWI